MMELSKKESPSLSGPSGKLWPKVYFWIRAGVITVGVTTTGVITAGVTTSGVITVRVITAGVIRVYF